MDANGQRFWLLAEDRHWPGRAHVEYRSGCRALRLAGERTLGPAVEGAAGIAVSALERVPRAVDRQGAVAVWDEVAMAIVAASYLPDTTVTLALSERPLDFTPGFDDVLYVALRGRMLLHDLRARWPDQILATPDFQPWRMAADPQGGAWALERTTGRLARLTGCVDAARPAGDYRPSTFRPDPENTDPPRLTMLTGIAWAEGERPQALAVAPDGTLAVLSWVGDGESRIRVVDHEQLRLGVPQRLIGARFAYAFDWLSDARLAVRVAGRRDVPVFMPRLYDAMMDGVVDLQPSGDIYPLAAEAEEGPFAHRLDAPPRYPLAGGGVAPLHRLSVSRLARYGVASNFDGIRTHLIDGGDQRTIWHRVYAEVKLPVTCGMVVWLSTSAEPQPPPLGAVERWHPHVFGEVPAGTIPLGPVPRAAWERQASELPGHPGLGAWGKPDPGRAGLWTVLVQRNAQRVRALTGRYLWCRVECHGDGADSPELAALRIYGSRFSYRDRYLARLYRETEYGAAAEQPGDRLFAVPAAVATELDAASVAPRMLCERLGLGETARLRVVKVGERWEISEGPARWTLVAEARTGVAGEGGQVVVYRWRSSPADFLERFLGNMEGWLTPLEDRIAAAHLVSDPDVAPAASLDWLGGWIGVAFDPGLPEKRRRAWLANAAQMARFHGTARGLQLALNLATGGGVSGGEIVVLEGFRLRRLMATLLGVDLNVPDDPLLPGLVVSSNSVVGDTLVLGETERVELLALFRDEIATDAERQSVLAFYDRLAFRALILVHQDVEPQDLGLIRRVVELEAPAHIETRVEVATWPLLVGIASLVGVDTYLRPRPPRRPARADRSELGNGDYVSGVGSLDPRLSGATPALGDLAPAAGRPVADAGPDFSAPHGRSFELDGSSSTAPPGRRITQYRWLRTD